MRTRPLNTEEFIEIISLIKEGFEYTDENNSNRIFYPNERIALALKTQALTGLRIGDIITLKLENFKDGYIYIREEKTDKIQNREINSKLISELKDFAIKNKISFNEKLFPITVRAVQKQLKIAVNELELSRISSHSFRKFYATQIYEKDKDIHLVSKLLNHSNVTTTEKYLGLTDADINKASKSIWIDI